MTCAIEVSGVAVHYGSVHALDDVTLRLKPATTTALVGMNGSGKSTLFNALMGVIAPQNGTIMIGSRTVAAARKAGAVAYVPQADQVDTSFPVDVRGVVEMGRFGHLGLTRRLRAHDRAVVTQSIERVGLAALARRHIGELSGGQRKRAFVARAIAQQAPVLLLDEPFAGVDKPSEAMITRVLRDLASEGHTVVISTHDVAALTELADEVVLLRNRVLFHGPAAQAVQPSMLARAFGWEAKA